MCIRDRFKSDNNSLPENHLPKVIDSIVKQPAKTIVTPKESDPELEMRELLTEINENSEIGSSSSEVISIVKQDSRESDHISSSKMSTALNRPNRLSFGQHSVESDQNTMEISSADDVKNESTDITSPESSRESIEESLPVSMGSKKSNVKEISNTSLNTLGNDSDEEGSDLEVDFGYSKKEKSVKRFDTISSNGESSYRVEEPNYLSVSEEPELEEYIVQEQDICEEVFDSDKRNLMDNIREIAASEVDRICEEAIDKMSEFLILKPNAEDANNVSESSVLSAVDSVIAEKGSDFDSLSFLDEPSDSRSVSMFGDDTRSCRSESTHEAPIGFSPQDDAQKTIDHAVSSTTSVTEVSWQYIPLISISF